MTPLCRCIGSVALAAFLSGTALAAQTPDAGQPEPAPIDVTIDNFVRAATDFELAKYVALAGGVNRFYHFREPTPVQHQPTIQMNRDTLYSAAIVDISKGATLSLPDMGDRYMSAMVVNQDHYINEIFVDGGTHALDMETFGTPYVGVFLRVLVDASDPQDVAAVNALQDRMSIEAGSAAPFVVPPYDRARFDHLLRAVIEIGRFAPDSFRVFGKREDVDPLRHVVGSAVGWGGLPETEAFYLNVNPGLPVGTYAISVPADVPVGAFWSVSVYNASKYFEPNPQDAYVVNSVSGTRNGDGSMTVHLGGCDDGRVNCLPITEGWNYTVRLYRPEPQVLDGGWSFPAAQPVQ